MLQFFGWKVSFADYWECLRENFVACEEEDAEGYEENEGYSQTQ